MERLFLCFIRLDGVFVAPDFCGENRFPHQRLFAEKDEAFLFQSSKKRGLSEADRKPRNRYFPLSPEKVDEGLLLFGELDVGDISRGAGDHLFDFPIGSPRKDLPQHFPQRTNIIA